MTDHELAGSLLAIPDPHERSRMLDAACGGDEEMRYRVERMMSRSRPAKVVTSATSPRRRPSDMPFPIKSVSRVWLSIGASMIVGAGFAPLMLERVIPDLAVLGPVIIGVTLGICGAMTRLGMAKDVAWSATISLFFGGMMFIPALLFDLTRTPMEVVVLCGWLMLASAMIAAGAIAFVHRLDYLQWRHPNHTQAAPAPVHA